MISLIEVAKNPAYSLSAMIYGLQNPIETKDVKYQVSMETFGSISEDGSVCYGCAATSALEVITGRSLIEYGSLHNNWHRTCFTEKVFNTDKYEQDVFELAIDSVRTGSFTLLMDFFGHEYDEQQYDDDYTRSHQMNTRRQGRTNRPSCYRTIDGFNDLYMTSCNWKDAVPEFEKVINEMHEDYPDWERFTAPGEQND